MSHGGLMKSYGVLRPMGLALLAALQLASVVAADAGHTCSTIPKGAQSTLERSVASLLEEHGAALRDWQGRPVQLRGVPACLDAALADFDGTGSDDVVALYRVGDVGSPALLLSAFYSGNEWRGSVVEIVPGAQGLSVLPAGEYARSPAVTRKLRPGEKAVVTSGRPGVAISMRPTSCLAFFLSDHRWVFTERACE